MRRSRTPCEPHDPVSPTRRFRTAVARTPQSACLRSNFGESRSLVQDHVADRKVGGERARPQQLHEVSFAVAVTPIKDADALVAIPRRFEVLAEGVQPLLPTCSKSVQTLIRRDAVNKTTDNATCD